MSNNGQNKFLGRDTRTSVINKCLEEFFEYYDAQPNGMSPSEVERKLTTQLNDEILEHNETSSRDKWSKINELPPNVVAAVMLHIEHVAVISFTQETSAVDEDSSLLAIYVTDGPNEGTWSASNGELIRKIHQYSSMMSSRGVEEVIRCLKAHADCKSVTVTPTLCPVKNGIYDRETHSLLPFSPKYVYMSKLQTNYNPDAENPLIIMPDGKTWDCESQLDSFSDDPELQQLFREILTAAVFPHHKWDKAILPYSTKGNNGKGTFAALIRAMLGADAWCSISLREFSMDFMCSSLITCNAVITDENDVGAYIDSAANFKSCTTHDTITINRKYKTPVKIRWGGFIMECINELPRFHDRSESMLRRFLIIPFDKSFKGTERKYIKTDYLEREAVREYYLKIALESDIQELSCPQACLDALAQYRTYNDPLRDFFESQVENYTAWKAYPMTFIYEHYKAWYTQTHPGGTVLPLNKFRIDLATMAIESEHWECPGPDKVTHIPSDAMIGVEEAIINYQLEQYMNKTYHGTDPEKITNFKRPNVARGVLIKVDNGHKDPDKGDDKDYIKETDNNTINNAQNHKNEQENKQTMFNILERKEIIEQNYTENVSSKDLNSTDVEDKEPTPIIPPNPLGFAPQTGEVYRQRVSTGLIDSYSDTPLPNDATLDLYQSSQPNDDYGLDI